MNNRSRIISDLVAQCSVKLATYAKYCGADDTLAKDAASFAFLKICRMETIDTNTAKAWLYKVCRNYVFSELKKRKREPLRDESDRILFADISPTPSQNCEAADTAKLLFSEIDKLPSNEREAVFMRYYGFLDYAQIAYILNITPNNVGVILSRAIAKLRIKLKDVL